MGIWIQVFLLWVISLTPIDWLLKLLPYYQSSLTAKRIPLFPFLPRHTMISFIPSDSLGTLTYSSPWGRNTLWLGKWYWSRQIHLTRDLVLLGAGTVQQFWELSKWAIKVWVPSAHRVLNSVVWKVHNALILCNRLSLLMANSCIVYFGRRKSQFLLTLVAPVEGSD